MTQLTNFEEATLRRLLYKRLEHDGMGRNSPKELHTGEIAKRFGITNEEVIERMRNLKPAARHPE